jgi:ABC-2 type transport system permease protein
MNTMIGSIMLIISIIIYIFIGKDKLDIMLGIKGFSQAISDYTPIVLGCFMLLTCTTHPSISLEGKHAWIMKTIPVSPIKIFLSKIMVNLTISIPFLIVSAILLKIYLKLSINTFILMLVIPTLYSTFISMFGVIINMCFVNFEWKNEITIIKQSLPAFISILFPMLLAVLPFVIEHNLSISQLNILIIIIAILLNIICFIILNTISTKQFQKLNC